MAIYIALLRGINVGGKNIIKMANLKQAFEDLDLGLCEEKHIFKYWFSKKFFMQ